MVLRSHMATVLLLSIVFGMTTPAFATPRWPTIGSVVDSGSVLATDFVTPTANPYTLSVGLIPSVRGALTPGQSLDLTVRFSDLDPTVPEIISAYDLIVTFDPLLLNVTGVSFPGASVDALTDQLLFGPELDNSFNGTLSASSGQIRFSAFSFAFDDELEGLQAGFETFDAVEISFEALANGQSAFGYIYDPDAEIDIKGPTDPNNPGFAIIYDVNAASAPPVLPMLLSGLALLGLLTRGGSRLRVGLRFGRSAQCSHLGQHPGQCGGVPSAAALGIARSPS